jgi:uncharacterized membrane protein
MILMAIDHVRVYSGVPAGGPSPGVFFTRWITHFVAPAFVFLAGSAAFLHGRRLADEGALRRYLLTRGAWLILLELTVIRVSWTFNFDYAHYLLAGVIWVIGWCMILLGVAVRLPFKAIAAIGLVILFGHNVTDLFGGSVALAAQSSRVAWLWQLLYYGGPIQLGTNGPTLSVLYSVLPWFGVISCGYAFGAVLCLPNDRRRRTCYAVGASAIAAFVLLRAIDRYGDPRPWRAQASGAIAPGGPTVRPQNQAGAPGAVAPPSQPRTSTASAAAERDSSSARPTPGENPTRRRGSVPAPGVRGPRGIPAPIAFLNTSKYPASLLFLLMTLGPLLVLLPVAERATGRIGSVFATFGRVPLFYYLLHIPVIHLLAGVVSIVKFGSVSPWLLANHPTGSGPPPAGYTWSLGLLYAVFLVAVTLLYFPSRWFARRKRESRNRWLSYL